MRYIIAGCEYAGKTTLANNFQEWGKGVGIRFHMDDHFTIPDSQHLNEDEQERMVNLGPTMKERFQRFQVYYHIKVLNENEHTMIVGGHIEEAVYGPRYYYDRALPGLYQRKTEAELPDDTILVLLSARPEVIADRMKAAPRKYGLVKEEEIEEVSELFRQEFGQSWLRPKLQIDSSDLTPEEVLEQCLSLSRPYLTQKDLQRLLNPPG